MINSIGIFYVSLAGSIVFISKLFIDHIDKSFKEDPIVRVKLNQVMKCSRSHSNNKCSYLSYCPKTNYFICPYHRTILSMDSGYQQSSYPLSYHIKLGKINPNCSIELPKSIADHFWIMNN